MDTSVPQIPIDRSGETALSGPRFRRATGAYPVGIAASTLGLSPTALSKSLQRLEKAVGVRLLNRTTRAVQLTAKGTLLLDQIAPPSPRSAKRWTP
jgi:hypothetical protein